MSVSSLKSNSTILHQLSESPRNQTLAEITDIMINAFISKPVSEWREVLDKSDYPHDYKSTFGFIVVNIMNLCLPEFMTKPIMTWLADLILGQKGADFLINKYLPILFDATKDVQIPILDRIDLISKGIGVIIKVVYGFLYQEQFLPKWINSFFDSSLLNTWGGNHISDMNSLADWFTGFKQTDANVVESLYVYPG